MSNKNILITNFWYSRNNYGANLTAYALQTILSELDFDSKFINNPVSFIRLTSKKSFAIPFQNKYLKATDYIDKNAYILNKKANIFITGSDQVFRPIYTPGKLEQYLLDFVGIEKKKIAFSASFGIDKEQFLKENSEETIEHMKQSLKSFDFISVREKSGIEICKNIFDVDAEWIIDPVFILDKSKYDELIKNSTINYSQKIVSYVLDTTKECKQAYKYLLKKYNKTVVETANSNISIGNWLASIRDCELFITDSFHGMCFALIFNKPFICLANKSRGRARFDSICEMLGVGNQCIDSILEVTRKDCVFKVDYEGVNERIKYERQRGLEFLNKALSAPVKANQEKLNVRMKYLETRVCELEEQNNLSYQLKKYLWEKWLIIYYVYLPKSMKKIISFLWQKTKEHIKK